MMELLYVLGRNLTEEISKPKPKPRPAERRGAAVVLLSVSGLGGGCDVANIDFPHRQQTLLPRGAMFPPARVIYYRPAWTPSESAHGNTPLSLFLGRGCPEEV